MTQARLRAISVELEAHVERLNFHADKIESLRREQRSLRGQPAVPRQRVVQDTYDSGSDGVETEEEGGWKTEDEN